MLYMGAIGMFGAGVGMLYTPILVDRLQLTFPSGLAVANILRALTDPVLLRRSVARLTSGIGLGLIGGVASAKLALLGAIDLSTSTLGAGLLVGARIGIPSLVAGLTGTALIPMFVSIGWLDDGAPFRKITFLIGLGLIMGAAIIDIGRILIEAVARWRSPSARAAQVGRTRLAALQHQTTVGVDPVLGWGSGVGWRERARPAAVLHGVRAGAGDDRHAGQRHLAGHQRFKPDLVGIRGGHRADGRTRPQRPERRPHRRRCAVGGHQRVWRHAARPLHRMAPGHAAHHPVSVSGARVCWWGRSPPSPLPSCS